MEKRRQFSLKICIKFLANLTEWQNTSNSKKAASHLFPEADTQVKQQRIQLKMGKEMPRSFQLHTTFIYIDMNCTQKLNILWMSSQTQIRWD